MVKFKNINKNLKLYISLVSLNGFSILLQICLIIFCLSEIKYSNILSSSITIAIIFSALTISPLIAAFNFMFEPWMFNCSINTIISVYYSLWAISIFINLICFCLILFTNNPNNKAYRNWYSIILISIFVSLFSLIGFIIATLGLKKQINLNKDETIDSYQKFKLLNKNGKLVINKKSNQTLFINKIWLKPMYIICSIAITFGAIFCLFSVDIHTALNNNKTYYSADFFNPAINRKYHLVYFNSYDDYGKWFLYDKNELIWSINFHEILANTQYAFDNFPSYEYQLELLYNSGEYKNILNPELISFIDFYFNIGNSTNSNIYELMVSQVHNTNKLFIIGVCFCTIGSSIILIFLGLLLFNINLSKKYKKVEQSRSL